MVGWLVVWNIFYFFHILGIIIQIDFHMFRGVGIFKLLNMSVQVPKIRKVVLVNITLTIKIDHKKQRIYNFKLEAFMPWFVAKRLLYDFDKFV